MANGSGSSTGAVTAAWARVAIPSAADLIFVALLCALVVTPLSTRLLGDAGIGWHIRAGQQILQTRAVPRVDPFSSTMGGKPWLDWEWLYDVVVGQLGATLGLSGVVWFTAIVIAAVFAWTFRLLIQRGTTPVVAVPLVLLAMSAATIHFLARPHVVSWWFTLAWFWILESSERKRLARETRDGTKLWMLPLLMLVWVNAHGGFVIGFVLLGIFWLSALWEWFRAKESRIEGLLQKLAAWKQVRDLTWAGLFSGAASLVNPYGWRLHEHVYGYLSNRFLMDHIDEFQSPNFHGLAQRCFLALLLITLAVLAVKGRELRMSQGLTVLFAVYAGLYASRNIPVSSVLLVMIVGPLMSPRPAVQAATAMKRWSSFFQRMTDMESRLRWHVWPTVVILLTFWLAASGGRLRSSLGMDAHFDPQRMPVAAGNFLEKSGVKGPVLSPDYWGGYLIYRFYPKIRVVVDDRHDLYGEEFFKSYLKMIRAEPGWQEFLQEHEAGCVLLPKQAALASLLLESRDWRAIYEDEVAIAFVRRPEREPGDAVRSR